MTTFELETKLQRRTLARRISLGVAALSFLVLFFVFLALLEGSKEVIQNPIIYDGVVVHPGFKTERYNEAYITPMSLSLFISIFAGSLLFGDLISCRFQTITKDLQDLTIYRGCLFSIVYVDGVEQGRIGPFTFTNVVEVWLPDKTRATVSFSKSVFYLAHISFSDSTSSIEI